MNDILFLTLTILSFAIIFLALILRLGNEKKFGEICFVFELMSYALLITTFVLQMVNTGWTAYSFGVLFALLTIVTLVAYRLVFRFKQKRKEKIK